MYKSRLVQLVSSCEYERGSRLEGYLGGMKGLWKHQRKNTGLDNLVG